MMSEWIAAGFLLVGAAFTRIAALGIVRMQDVYLRMHAATKTGTLGLGLICVGAGIMAESWTARVEILLILVFMLVTAPIGAHLIGRAAFRAGVPFMDRTRFEEGCEQFGAPALDSDNHESS